jgi:type IV pilus assembly protein PilC
MAQPAYKYKAVDRGGKSVEDRIEADDSESAVRRLQARGLVVLDIRPLLNAEERSGAPGHRGGRAKLDDLAAASREFSIMCRSGMPVTEALAGIAEHMRPGAVRDALSAVRSRVIEGSALSDALSEHPRVFSELYVDMVRTAEEGGGLDQALTRAADHTDRILDMRRKVISALMYPSLLAGISVVTVGLMVGFILPRFMFLFDRMQIEVPLATRMLMGLSKAVTTYWYVLPIGVAAALALRRLLRDSPGYRRAIARLQLKTPVLGDLTRKLAASRCMSALGTLLASNVPMMTALRTAAASAQNLIISDSLAEAREAVEHGGSLAEAIGDTGEFPPLIHQMIAAGERTGELPEILRLMVEFYDGEIDAKIKGLTSIIEPVMIIALGCVVGFVAVAIISPIYTLVGGVH